MSLDWIHESPAHWDDRKSEIFKCVPDGVFEMGDHEPGDLMPGEWWRVEEDGTTLGYGWMDCTWGDAEMLLVVDPRHVGKGVGTFILDQLEKEAGAHGVNYLYNVVRVTHPDREGITRWLKARRFAESGDGLLKRGVAHGD